MTENIRLIGRQLNQLQRMSVYLRHSVDKCMPLFPVVDWQSLGLDEHEMLAALRVRFSEFQEHLGKTMRAVAIEEEVDAERFGSVLAFMEKMCVIESAERWKIIREIRNAINHEYEEDAVRLSELFTEMLKAAPELFGYLENLGSFCMKAYGIHSE